MYWPSDCRGPERATPCVPWAIAWWKLGTRSCLRQPIAWSKSCWQPGGELQLPRALRKLDNFDFLVVDDLGYLPLGATESEVLFTLMAERYERRAMGITSNLVFSQWDQVFQNPMATAAAIDRVVHHAVILEFDVPSFRTGQTQEHLREEADDNYRQGVQRQK